jgi:hypothetical protein
MTNLIALPVWITMIAVVQVLVLLAIVALVLEYFLRLL